jgi:hypothetical protein
MDERFLSVEYAEPNFGRIQNAGEPNNKNMKGWWCNKCGGHDCNEKEFKIMDTVNGCFAGTSTCCATIKNMGDSIRVLTLGSVKVISSHNNFTNRTRNDLNAWYSGNPPRVNINVEKGFYPNGTNNNYDSGKPEYIKITYYFSVKTILDELIGEDRILGVLENLMSMYESPTWDVIMPHDQDNIQALNEIFSKACLMGTRPGITREKLKKVCSWWFSKFINNEERKKLLTNNIEYILIPEFKEVCTKDFNCDELVNKVCPAKSNAIKYRTLCSKLGKCQETDVLSRGSGDYTSCCPPNSDTLLDEEESCKCKPNFEFDETGNCKPIVCAEGEKLLYKNSFHRCCPLSSPGLTDNFTCKVSNKFIIIGILLVVIIILLYLMKTTRSFALSPL